jgi:hypothetical protein
MEAGRHLAGLAFRGMLRAGKELALLPGDFGRCRPRDGVYAEWGRLSRRTSRKDANGLLAKAL